ncbi:MAG: diacylglycerol kinase, partial [Candidatus Omnitrophota bacterium]
NTAIEMSTDLISDSYNPVIRIIKDVSAGCVLITSVNALVVGYILFLSRPWGLQIEHSIDKIRASSWHITFIILLLVLFLVILGKVLFHKGTPLRGGMPSGHAALSFAIWTIVAFLTSNHLAIVLTFVLAFLVARSRLSGRIHNFWEIVAGGAIGALVPALIFQIVR